MFYKKFLQCPAHSSPSKNRTELQQHRFCTSEFDRLLALCQVSKIVVFTEKKRKYACFQEKFEKSANHIFFLRVGRKKYSSLSLFNYLKIAISVAIYDALHVLTVQLHQDTPGRQWLQNQYGARNLYATATRVTRSKPRSLCLSTKRELFRGLRDFSVAGT